jgi:hypothetical protein
VGNRAGSTPAPGTKTASKEAVFLVLLYTENLEFWFAKKKNNI